MYSTIIGRKFLIRHANVQQIDGYQRERRENETDEGVEWQ